MNADDVIYSNTTSGLVAVEVQAAVDEVVSNIEGLEATDIFYYDLGAQYNTVADIINNMRLALFNLDASNLEYSNNTSGLSATNVKNAIDEVVSDMASNNVFVANDSRVKTAINAAGSAPIYACRSFISFNGQGTVNIIQGSNVLGIIDHGVGDYSIVFLYAMPDNHYVCSIIADDNSNTNINIGHLYTAAFGGTDATNQQFRFLINNTSVGPYDTSLINVVVTR